MCEISLVKLKDFDCKKSKLDNVLETIYIYIHTHTRIQETHLCVKMLNSFKRKVNYLRHMGMNTYIYIINKEKEIL